MEDLFGIFDNNNVYHIVRPYEPVDTTFFEVGRYAGYHSTKRGTHNSNAHTKKRKSKRRLNKKHNK